MGEWQPIETAPRDGSDILVYCGPLDPIWGIASWYRDNPDVPAGLPEGWMMWHQATEDQRHTWPTHWRPLPSPPEHVSPQDHSDLSTDTGEQTT